MALGISDLPAGYIPAYRDMSGEWRAFMGVDRDDQASYNSAVSRAKAPADEAWVYSCVKRISDSAQTVPLRVYVRTPDGVVSAAEMNDADGLELQYLIDYVNPDEMTGSDLKAFTAASYAVWGESFVAKVRGQYGGRPQELYWLRSPDVEVKSDDGRTPTRYIHSAGTKQTEYKVRDMIPMKTVNLVNPLRGLSPLAPIADDIAVGKMLASKSAERLRNDSIPPGYWTVPRDAEFTKQDENLVRRTLRVLRQKGNKGKVPIMPLGIEYKGIALTPQQAEAIATGKVSRMAICAVLQVPLVLAGDDDKNTVYGNTRDAERIFWRSYLPTLDKYADAYNNWLVPDFDPTRRRLFVAFDYSDIEALRPTLDVEWNAWLGALYAQAVVPDEFRAHFKVGGKVPWGAKPVPRTQIAVKAPEATDPAIIPALDPALGAANETGDAAAAVFDPSSSLRAYGKALYRHPAVRAYVSTPGEPLAVHELFAGHYVDTPTRLAIERGLRRRDSASVIADALSEVSV